MQLKVKFLRATECEVVDESELALDMFCTAVDLYKHADDLLIYTWVEGFLEQLRKC